MATVTDSTAIDRLLRDAADVGDVPHVAAIVADRDGIIYEGGAGKKVHGETDAEVGTDTPFRIMSMTKIVATVAALQQRDRGELDLAAPVETYVPAFAEIKVLDGFDGDTPTLRAPATKPTVWNLLTHTSGLSYWFWDENIVRYEQFAGIPNVVPGDKAALTAPMVHDPGDRFTYGINLDWLGLVVEAVAGTTLDVVVKEQITGPLGMDHTGFRMSEEQRDDAVSVHVPDGRGGWAAAGNIIGEEPDWWAGGHGLYSTPRDYIRFEQALLRGGELDGERILSSATVDEAFTNQIGALDFPPEISTADPSSAGPFNAGPGWKWGWGLLLNTQDVPGARRAGSGAWAGLFNTHFWVDRTTGICASIYTNSLPFATPEALTLYGAFEQTLYASLS